jgi:hypothetical protein
MRVLFFLLTVSIAHAASIIGKVVGISDGDKEQVKLRKGGQGTNFALGKFGGAGPRPSRPVGC